MYANKDVKIEFGNKNNNNIGSTFNREYIYKKDFFLFNDWKKDVFFKKNIFKNM